VCVCVCVCAKCALNGVSQGAPSRFLIRSLAQDSLFFRHSRAGTTWPRSTRTTSSASTTSLVGIRSPLRALLAESPSMCGSEEVLLAFPGVFAKSHPLPFPEREFLGACVGVCSTLTGPGQSVDLLIQRMHTALFGSGDAEVCWGLRCRVRFSVHTHPQPLSLLPLSESMYVYIAFLYRVHLTAVQHALEADRRIAEAIMSKGSSRTPSSSQLATHLAQ
jgi:hypothetical protein